MDRQETWAKCKYVATQLKLNNLLVDKVDKLQYERYNIFETLNETK